MQYFSKTITTIGRSHSYRKRSIILYQGEIPRHGYFITEGEVKAYMIAENGDEKIAAIYVAGDLLPQAWLFGRATGTLFYYEAVNDTRVVAFSKNEFFHHLQKDKSANDDFQQYLMFLHIAAIIQNTALIQNQARDKLIYFLYFLTYRFKCVQNGDIHTVHVDLNHALIASMLGLTRETVTLELNKLRTKKAVNYSQGTYYKVNKSILEQMIGEDSLNSLVP